MSERPNVLFLVHRVPYPPNRGDRIRSFHLLKHLALRANVYLATLADEPLEPESLRTLHAYCQAVAIERLGKQRWLQGIVHLARGRSATEGLFRSVPLQRTIERWASKMRFSAVVVFCSSMVQYLDTAGLEGVPAIIDLVDVDSQKFFDYAAAQAFWKAWLYRLEGRRLRDLEKSIARRAAVVTLVSEAEADVYCRFCPNNKTLGITNGVDLEYFQARTSPPVVNRCVFVGALDYPPNIDAMQWFCREVWPRVRSLLPDATLDIVGRNPTRAVRQLSESLDVHVVGTVPDVRPYMASASVAVAPLRIARGIQNKVLEAMAMGLPMIASPGALEGLALAPGKEVLQAETADEWVDAVVQLCRNRAVAERLSSAGRKFVETMHSWSACLQPLDDAILGRVAPRHQDRLLASVP